MWARAWSLGGVVAAVVVAAGFRLDPAHAIAISREPLAVISMAESRYAADGKAVVVRDYPPHVDPSLILQKPCRAALVHGRTGWDDVITRRPDSICQLPAFSEVIFAPV